MEEKIFKELVSHCKSILGDIINTFKRGMSKEDVYSYYKWGILNDRFPLLGLRNYRKKYSFLYGNLDNLYTYLLAWGFYSLYDNYKKSNNLWIENFYVFVSFSRDSDMDIMANLHFAFGQESIQKELSLYQIVEEKSDFYLSFEHALSKMHINDRVNLYSYQCLLEDGIVENGVLVDLNFKVGNKIPI